MGRVACIHQPNYLPWLGYFSKIKNSDVYIAFDSAQYVKNSFSNRNRIRTKDGWAYLTIPVSSEYYFKPYCEVRLPTDDRWRKRHWTTITANYSRAAHFADYKAEFEKILLADYPSIADLNLALIKFVMDSLSIKTQVVRSSEMKLDPQKKKTDALLEILEKAGATEYLSGTGASTDYLEKEKFTKISLRWHEYKPPQYPQAFPGFETGLAAIDALFNLGPKAAELL